jgi:hypothetical protein
VLCRSTRIVHKPSGVAVETPLLIPSFSSKGFVTGAGTDELLTIVQTASEVITGAYLISAYDIAKGHLPPPAALPMKPDLIFLDSGGYEISDEFDFSEIMRSDIKADDWSVKELIRVLDMWPPEMPAVLVSYDHPKERRPLAEQLAAARELFKKHHDQLNCFLLKQVTTTQTSLAEVLAEATAKPDDFRSFDTIGLTEKGLGQSPIQRMVRIARFRRALDEAGLKVPIHIFGSLDPVSVSLYFLAGAELFDGLTWLRYAFVRDRESSKDQCGYIHSQGTIEYGIHTKDKDQKLRAMKDNYYYLEDLAERLKHFESTQDFSKLPHSEFMKEASEKLEGELRTKR